MTVSDRAALDTALAQLLARALVEEIRREQAKQDRADLEDMTRQSVDRRNGQQ